MNIIIAGDGEVGFHLATSLTDLGYNITVVDPHSDLLERLETTSDLLTIAGSSTSPKVLKEANVSSCDLFLSVLHDESINLVTCILAKKFHARKTVARISNVELVKHREMFRELGVDELVCPEHIATKEITNLLNNTYTQEFFDFAGGLLTMNLIRVTEASPLAYQTREDFANLAVRFVAVLRNGDTMIPHSDFLFKVGDLVYIITKPGQNDVLKELAAIGEMPIHRVMIAGGGRVGRYTAMALDKQKQVTLIDEDIKRCEQLSNDLQNTLVINGDATDISLLQEEGISNTDAFIAVTESSETNVLTCLNARRLGVKRTIALVENTGFINISQDIGIDTIINKKLITASYIARFIVNAEAVSSKWLSGTNAELIEFVVGKYSPATRRPIGQMGMPNGATIGGLIRGKEIILPTHETQLLAGDKVVVFTLPQVMNQVARLFKKTLIPLSEQY